MAGLLMTIGLAAACGDGSSAAPYTVTVTGNPVAYAAIQDGDGAWHQLTFDATGTASFEVTRGYHGMIAVCPSSRYGYARYDVGAMTWRPCGAPVARITASGAVTPSTAIVWLGLSGLYIPGDYQITIAAGRYDLVATTPTRAVIVRDQQIDADWTHDVDVDADGFDLTTLTPTVPSDADPTRSYAEILTANRTYVQTGSGGFAVVPTAQRAVGDQVVIGAERVVGAGGETVQREVHGDAVPALTFDVLPTLAIGRSGGQWGDGWDFVSMSYRRPGSPGGLAQTAASEWMAVSGRDALALLDPADLPGWDPTWFAPTAGDAISLSIGAGIGDLSSDYQYAYQSATGTW